MDKVKSLTEELQNMITKRNDFLNHLTHEIRTPLVSFKHVNFSINLLTFPFKNGVIGITELLLETSLSSKQREYANVVYKSSETLLKLLNELMDSAKKESAKRPANSEPVKISEIMRYVTKLYSPAAQQKGKRSKLKFH